MKVMVFLSGSVTEEVMGDATRTRDGFVKEPVVELKILLGSSPCFAETGAVAKE